MHRFERYEKALTPVGAIVVRFYHSGDQIRCYVRQVEDDEHHENIFPGEELEPEVGLRLAENRLQDHPGEPVYIELSEGVAWNPDWVEQIS